MLVGVVISIGQIVALSCTAGINYTKHVRVAKMPLQQYKYNF